MATIGLSLREPPFTADEPVPILGAEVGGVTIAALASAVGFWSGRAGEMPAARAAFDVLRAKAEQDSEYGSVDWGARLPEAFEAAFQALAAMPWPADADADTPYACLVAVVATGDSLWIGWAGDLVVARVSECAVVEHTVAHCPLAEFEHAEPGTVLKPEHREKIDGFKSRYLDGRRGASKGPEFTRWAALRPGERLLITPYSVFALVRNRLPEPTLDDPQWLRSVLAIDAERRNEYGHQVVGDRLGALVRG